MNLPSIALAHGILVCNRLGTPRALYEPDPSKQKNNGVPHDYIRPLATIEPLAILVGMPVDPEFEMTEVDPLIEKIVRQEPARILSPGSTTGLKRWRAIC